MCGFEMENKHTHSPCPGLLLFFFAADISKTHTYHFSFRLSVVKQQSSSIQEEGNAETEVKVEEERGHLIYVG